MCGFAGILGPAGPAAERAATARSMAATLAHRGPDDEGSWVDPRGEVAFGFRRLSIIDLTPEGHQPMHSADGRYTVVFNGEIYNFATLRSELEALGRRFRGRSDTEVLLASIVEWGLEAALPRLWGMFAFVLWDARERVLNLARDRIGKKPLYFGWQGQTLLFGSELKALRAHPGFAASIDRDALASYLRFCYVPAPYSIHRGINKLPPASWVTLRPDRPGESPAAHRYWDPIAIAHAGQENPDRLPDAEAARSLEALLSDAVRLRTVADVPIGAFLSGGIDSSTIVALLQAQSGRKVRTFTIGFTYGEYDESANARGVAEHLGTDHTELLVTPDEALAVLPRLPTLYDEPFADSSQVPTFLVSQLARRQVTVALSGDGGDEMFGGYHRYVAGTRLWSLARGLPRPLRRAAVLGLELFSPSSWDRIGVLADRALPRSRRGLVTGNRMQKLATVLGMTELEAIYERLVSTWPEPERLLREGRETISSPLGDHRADGLFAPAHRMMLLDLLGYLPDDILVKVDRASMGASLEARAPYLDHRIAEFAWRLPIRQKIRAGEGKWLLRRVLERHVPRALFERPKKGFGVPIDAWLRGPLREWTEDLLSEERLRREGFFDPAPIRKALREHLEGTRNRQYELWAILMFEAWRDAQAGAGWAS